MSEQQRPWWALGCADEMTARDVRNARRMNLLIVAFMLSVMVAKFAMARYPLGIPLTVLAMLLPAVVGGFYYRAVGTFLREADELTRSIHTQAMAVAAGAALGAWVFEALWEEAAVLLGEPVWSGLLAGIANPVMGLALGYAVALVLLQRRYAG
jgi:hypothetical protein